MARRTFELGMVVLEIQHRAEWPDGVPASGAANIVILVVEKDSQGAGRCFPRAGQQQANGCSGVIGRLHEKRADFLIKSGVAGCAIAVAVLLETSKNMTNNLMPHFRIGISGEVGSLFCSKSGICANELPDFLIGVGAESFEECEIGGRAPPAVLST